MKILYLCFDDGIDLSGVKGASIHVRSFVRALTELGHEVTVVGTKVSSPDSFEVMTDSGVLAAPLSAWNRRLSRALRSGNRSLGRSLGRSRDVVRAFHNSGFLRVVEKSVAHRGLNFIYERYSLWGMAGIRLARKWSIPLVLEVNSPLAYEEQSYREGLTFPALAQWAERRVWRRADLLVAVSQALRGHLVKAGAAPDKIRILPNAVDMSLFRTMGDDLLLRSWLNLDGRFVVGFVGSFKPWHGVDFLLRAFARMRGEDDSLHLLLVGDGPMRKALEEETLRLDLQGAVTFVGNVPHEEIPRYLAAMDVAVAPYPALEDFYYSPLKLYEYMAGGRAVVASGIGQVAEVVADGLTGLLYEPGDCEGLARCIRRLRSDDGLRSELGKNARIASSKNTWKHSAERVLDWIEPLLEHKALLLEGRPECRACQGEARDL